MENSELSKFYTSIQQEIKSSQISDQEGGIQEEIFTQISIDLLADAGETENARVAFDAKSLGTKNQHKINAYAEPDNYETIDLFITIFKGGDDISRVSKDEIDTAAKRIANFFRKAKYKDYVNEIEESSPIFDFAHTLSSSIELKENLIRINGIILTDGIYPGEIPENLNIAGYPLNYRVIDINYLYNITEKSHIPIQINFKDEGYNLPCIISPSINDDYQSYLAIIPGEALAKIYELYGSRLLEQNVRSFLLFNGKINKGIRNTIIKEPHMFLAFNNGLAATAEEVIIENKNGSGYFINWVKDLQIVNGGQTTASIYHTWKKDQKDISGISVQMKLSVIKNKKNFSGIVSQISRYANTQNKVSESDLSSNNPFHIELEKLSRSIWAPPQKGSSVQTKWFYERARGQYKNARIKEGFTKSRQKAFDIQNPKNQMITKEDLAKYLNSWQELWDGKKLVIGPHYVVRGNQKNYVQFVNFNSIKKPDNIYFEDLVAKSILFRKAEKIYGIKPNAIGDMRYITVPYTIALLGYKTSYKVDLYRIWKNQSISDNLSSFLFELLKKTEEFIKSNAPGSLYGEWAKKEDCWNNLKEADLEVDFSGIQQEFEDNSKPQQRKRITEDETEKLQVSEDIEKLKAIPFEIWKKIEDWGRTTELLTQQQRDTAYHIALRLKNNKTFSEYERTTGLKIIDIIIDKAPEMLFEIEENTTLSENPKDTIEITKEVIQKIVQWDKKNKKLRDFEFKFMLELAEGRKELTERNKLIVKLNLNKVMAHGFKVL